MSERDDEDDGGRVSNDKGLVPLPRIRGDRILTAAAASLSAIPIVGGPLGTLLSAYAGDAVEQRLRDLIGSVETLLGERLSVLERLEERRQEQVARLLAEARLARDHRRLELLRNAIANVLLHDVEDVWFAQLSDCVNQLHPLEVAVVRLFFELPESAKRNNGTLRYFGTGVLEDAVVKAGILAAGAPTLLAILGRLVRFGLISDVGAAAAGVGNLEYLDKNEMGRRFLWFVELPSEEQEILATRP